MFVLTHRKMGMRHHDKSKKAHRAAQKAHEWKKVIKSIRGMPWLSEAMKDVISCDKPWGSANEIRSGDFRMGKPAMLKTWHNKSEPAELKHLSKQRKRK